MNMMPVIGMWKTQPWNVHFIEILAILYVRSVNGLHSYVCLTVWYTIREISPSDCVSHWQDETTAAKSVVVFEYEHHNYYKCIATVIYKYIYLTEWV